MANEQNLRPSEYKLSQEEAKRGGINSGKARREKKMVRDILSELLDGQIKNSPQFAKLASKMGVESDKSVKDIFTMVCLLNSVKNGNLGDLERLSKLLGEDRQNENADVLAKLDRVIGEVDKLAE